MEVCALGAVGGDEVHERLLFGHFEVAHLRVTCAPHTLHWVYTESQVLFIRTCASQDVVHGISTRAECIYGTYTTMCEPLPARNTRFVSGS